MSEWKKVNAATAARDSWQFWGRLSWETCLTWAWLRRMCHNKRAELLLKDLQWLLGYLRHLPVPLTTLSRALQQHRNFASCATISLFPVVHFSHIINCCCYCCCRVDSPLSPPTPFGACYMVSGFYDLFVVPQSVSLWVWVQLRVCHLLLVPPCRAARGKRNCFNLQSLGFSSHATVVKLPLYYLCNVEKTHTLMQIW